MPYVVLLFVTRHPDMTPAEFQDYYNNKHMPLLLDVAGSDFPQSHKRHFVQREESDSTLAAVLIGTQTDFTYDAVAVNTFNDKAAFQTFMAKMAASEAVTNDEKHFTALGTKRAVLLGDISETTPRTV